MFKRRTIILFLVAGALLLAGGSSRLFLKTPEPIEMAARISQNLDHKIRMVDQEAAQLLSSNDEAIWKGVSHSFFLMDSSAVLRWNKNDFLPDPRLIQEEFVFRFLQSARGSF